MNRQQRRRKDKELKNISKETRDYMAVDTITYCLAVVKQALNKEFGFGDKRYSRLEKAIHKVLKED